MRVGVRDRGEGGGRHHGETCARRLVRAPVFIMERSQGFGLKVVFFAHASEGLRRAFLYNDTARPGESRLVPQPIIVAVWRILAPTNSRAAVQEPGRGLWRGSNWGVRASEYAKDKSNRLPVLS